MLLNNSRCNFYWINILLLISCLVKSTFSNGNDSCDFISQTAFQLQLHGPILPENAKTFSAPTLAECSNLCCVDKTCDVALFVESNCTLINCPNSESDSCQPILAGINDAISEIKGKNSSLSFIKRRNSSDDLKLADKKDVADTPPKKKIDEPLKSSSTIEPKSISVTTSTPAVNLKEIVSSSTKVIPSNTSSAIPVSNATPVSISTPVLNTSSTQEVNAAIYNGSTTLPPTTVILTTSTMRSLHVQIIGSTKIQLPNDTVILHAEVKEPDSKTAVYDFKWDLTAHPDDYQGEETVHANVLKLQSLKAGDYCYKVEVRGDGAYGEAFVNITVKKPLRINQPPRAVIAPTHQDITLPNDATVLDGSGSHDDDKIASYLWKMAKKPIKGPDSYWSNNQRSVLELRGLLEGEYEFELTVTDTDGASNSTTATVTVNKKIDHKPKANAGGHKVIHMPRNSITLYANNSSDDYGIVSYSWALAPNSPNNVVDLAGTRTSELHLSHFEPGHYVIQLTVTDNSNQKGVDVVTITVLPEINHPPVANAGQDNQVFLPLDGSDLTANLDGSKSSDDKRIQYVEWKQSSGPMTSVIINPRSITTAVSGLNKAGDYVFLLNVTDVEGKWNTDTVTIIVNEIQPPTADPGPDQIVRLPDDVILLDGGNSHDEYGIKSYLWVRLPNSPAAGRIDNCSDVTSRLVVSGVAAGTYKFNLTVTNIRGKSAFKVATVKVLPNPLLNNLVELHLANSATTFTEEMKETIAKQIPLFLPSKSDERARVQTVYRDHRSGHLVLLFSVKRADGSFIPAIDVVATLSAKLQSDLRLLDADVIQVDTYICENNCSGHGECHQGSKRCECHTFWMQNFFRFYMGDGVSNCDWSVLYVVIVCCIIAATLVFLIYFVVRTCKRKRLQKKFHHKRRKKQYTPIDDGSEEKLILKPVKNGVVKNGFRKGASNSFHSSAFMRVATSSSEDDTLFEKQRLIKNGAKKKQRWKKRDKQQSNALIRVDDDPDSEREFDGTGLDGTVVNMQESRISDGLI